MAENKKSFQLYTEWIEVFEELDDCDAGQLIKHILNYVNDKNPVTENKLVKLSFIQIKHQLKRDLKKWESRVGASKLNGALGGRPKNLEKPLGYLGYLKEPRKPVEVEVEVEDKEEEEVNNIKKGLFKKDFESFINDCFKYLGIQYVNGNPSTHGIESPIRKWLLNQDANIQSNNLSAYIKTNPDKKFRAKTIDKLLEKLGGYNFKQDLKTYSPQVINGQPRKTKEQIEADKKEIAEIKKGYERMKTKIG